MRTRQQIRAASRKAFKRDVLKSSRAEAERRALNRWRTFLRSGGRFKPLSDLNRIYAQEFR